MLEFEAFSLLLERLLDGETGQKLHIVYPLKYQS